MHRTLCRAAVAITVAAVAPSATAEGDGAYTLPYCLTESHKALGQNAAKYFIFEFTVQNNCDRTYIVDVSFVSEGNDAGGKPCSAVSEQPVYVATVRPGQTYTRTVPATGCWNVKRAWIRTMSARISPSDTGPKKNPQDPPGVSSMEFGTSAETKRRQEAERAADEARTRAAREREERAKAQRSEAEERVRQAKTRAEEARQRQAAAEDRRRQFETRASALDAEAATQRQAAVASVTSGRGDAAQSTLQAELLTLSAQALRSGNEGASRAIQEAQRRSAQGAVVAQGVAGLVGGLVGLFMSDDGDDEAGRQAEEDRREERREREAAAQAEQDRRQAALRALDQERATAASEQRDAERQVTEAAAEVQAADRLQAHLALTASLKTSTLPSSTTLDLRPVGAGDRGGTVALKEVSRPQGPATGLKDPWEEAELARRDPDKSYLRVYAPAGCAIRTHPPLPGVDGEGAIIGVGPSVTSIVVSAPCTGVALLYVGRSPTPKGSGVFSNTRPLTVPLPRRTGAQRQ